MTRDAKANFLRSTPVLKSGNYARSRTFYEGKLGYRILEKGGDPPRFGIFERGQSVLFVNAWKGPPNPVPGVWEAYIHVTGLDALFAELQAAGARIVRPVSGCTRSGASSAMGLSTKL